MSRDSGTAGAQTVATRPLSPLEYSLLDFRADQDCGDSRKVLHRPRRLSLPPDDLVALILQPRFSPPRSSLHLEILGQQLVVVSVTEPARAAFELLVAATLADERVRTGA